MYQNMRRQGIVLVLVFFVFMAMANLSVCAKTTIKFAHAAGPDPYKSIEQSWASVFKAIVEAETGGDLEIVIYPSEQLGNQRQITEGVQMGTIDMGSISDAVLGLFYPKASILSIPFAFRESEDVLKFWGTDFAKEWANECTTETGTIKIFDLTTFGFRCFTNNVRPIKTPEDMKGLKIRVQESPIYVEIIKALGAIPTPMSVGELYSALQTGVVDGEENPPSVILLHSLQEVQKYFTNMGYIAGTQPIIINAKLYNSLSDEFKNAMEKAKHIASQAALGWNYIANYGVGLGELSKYMEIYTPTDEEREQFKSIMQPAALKVIEEKVGKEYLDKTLKVISNL